MVHVHVLSFCVTIKSSVSGRLFGHSYLWTRAPRRDDFVVLGPSASASRSGLRSTCGRDDEFERPPVIAIGEQASEPHPNQRPWEHGRSAPDSSQISLNLKLWGPRLEQPSTRTASSQGGSWALTANDRTSKLKFWRARRPNDQSTDCLLQSLIAWQMLELGTLK